MQEELRAKVAPKPWERGMPVVVESRDPEQEIRWRAWREKGRRADRLAKKRMKALLAAVGLILLALILYTTLRAG
jgi:hypothetical protein